MMDNLIDDTVAAKAENILAMLTPEKLKPILSRLASMTPDVVYFPEGFANQCKTLETEKMDKVNMTPLGRALTLVAATSDLRVGDNIKVTVGALAHGNDVIGNFEISCTRLPDDPSE